MNNPDLSRRAPAAALLTAAAALALAVSLAGCEGMAKPPHPQYNKKEVQHLYDTGQINYYEYSNMMQSMDSNWTPGTPPVPDTQFNDNPLRPVGTPGGTTP